MPENSSTGYLLIATSGGLNQQRIGITDAVVVAWILNATLVVPELDHRSFWKDDSEFSDIFDTDWFISYLSKDVTVVKRIPYEVMISMDKLPWTMRAPRKSMPEFYIDEVLPILMRRRLHGQLGRLICWLREYILISLLLRGILNAVLIGIIYEIIIVICE